jgi:hypothetical protein
LVVISTVEVGKSVKEEPVKERAVFSVAAVIRYEESREPNVETETFPAIPETAFRICVVVAL